MRIAFDPSPECRCNPGGQANFAADWTHGMVALEGGWGSGKTWAGARKLLTLHLHNAFDAAGRPTYVPHAVVAPTYRNAMDVNVPELLTACDEAGLSTTWKASRAELILPELGTRRRPSIILVRTADVPERITGWEVGGAWGDEAARWKSDRTDPRHDAFIQLTGRVRHPRANFRQLMLTYTNEGDCTRVYEEFHSGAPGRAWYRARTDENPRMAEFCRRQRRMLSEELKRQYLDGEAVSLRHARVYPAFEAAVHVDDSLRLRRELPLQLAADFNIAPGMHSEIGQYDPAADVFTVFDELHAPGMDVRQLVAELHGRIGRWGGFDWPALEVFGDATGSSRWAGTGESCYQILAAGLAALNAPVRFRVPRVNPPVVDRVNAMNVALRDLGGSVHWKCHSRCRRLIDDLRQLRRDEAGEIDKSDRRRSHASDAEGYRVAYQRPLRTPSHEPAGRFSVS